MKLIIEKVVMITRGNDDDVRCGRAPAEPPLAVGRSVRVHWANERKCYVGTVVGEGGRSYFPPPDHIHRPRIIKLF